MRPSKFRKPRYCAARLKKEKKEEEEPSHDQAPALEMRDLLLRVRSERDRADLLATFAVVRSEHDFADLPELDSKVLEHESSLGLIVKVIHRSILARDLRQTAQHRKQTRRTLSKSSASLGVPLADRDGEDAGNSIRLGELVGPAEDDLVLAVIAGNH